MAVAVRSAVVLTVLGVSGCGPVTACPAIGYSSTLVVELGAGWPDEPGRSVRVDCDGPCSDPPAAGGPDDVRTVELTGTSARIDWFDGTGDVVVTVLGPDGTELAAVDTAPEYERVGGTAECGGPTEATVTVPAP